MNMRRPYSKFRSKLLTTKVLVNVKTLIYWEKNILSC